MDNTLQYYNINAEKFFYDTVCADMSPIYDRFLRFVKPSAHICDLGCGSGRDSKNFRSRGYTVTAVDGSPEMCKLAEQYLKDRVYCIKFDEFEFHDEFDAIWACLSLLHVPYVEMKAIIKRIINGCKDGAIIYTCFKYGNTYSYRDGRLFSDYTSESFKDFLSSVPNLVLLEEWLSYDVRDKIDAPQWLNVILQVYK